MCREHMWAGVKEEFEMEHGKINTSEFLKEHSQKEFSMFIRPRVQLLSA